MPFYWERPPDGPFATLIRVTSNYLGPEFVDLRRRPTGAHSQTYKDPSAPA